MFDCTQAKNRLILLSATQSSWLFKVCAQNFADTITSVSVASKGCDPPRMQHHSLCGQVLCRDGYTIGYYGRPFEAKNKVRILDPGPLLQSNWLASFHQHTLLTSVMLLTPRCRPRAARLPVLRPETFSDLSWEPTSAPEPTRPHQLSLAAHDCACSASWQDGQDPCTHGAAAFAAGLACHLALY